MNIILVLIPLTLAFLAIAAWLFFWATNHGQFDDMQSPALLPMSDNLPSEEEEDDEESQEEESDDNDDTAADNTDNDTDRNNNS